MGGLRPLDERKKAKTCAGGRRLSYSLEEKGSQQGGASSGRLTPSLTPASFRVLTDRFLLPEINSFQRRHRTFTAWRPLDGKTAVSNGHFSLIKEKHRLESDERFVFTSSAANAAVETGNEELVKWLHTHGRHSRVCSLTMPAVEGHQGPGYKISWVVALCCKDVNDCEMKEAFEHCSLELVQWLCANGHTNPLAGDKDLMQHPSTLYVMLSFKDLDVAKWLVQGNKAALARLRSWGKDCSRTLRIEQLGLKGVQWIRQTTGEYCQLGDSQVHYLVTHKSDGPAAARWLQKTGQLGRKSVRTVLRTMKLPLNKFPLWCIEQTAYSSIVREELGMVVTNAIAYGEVTLLDYLANQVCCWTPDIAEVAEEAIVHGQSSVLEWALSKTQSEISSLLPHPHPGPSLQCCSKKRAFLRLLKDRASALYLHYVPAAVRDSFEYTETTVRVLVEAIETGKADILREFALSWKRVMEPQTVQEDLSRAVGVAMERGDIESVEVLFKEEPWISCLSWARTMVQSAEKAITSGPKQMIHLLQSFRKGRGCLEQVLKSIIRSSTAESYNLLRAALSLDPDLLPPFLDSCAIESLCFSGQLTKLQLVLSASSVMQIPVTPDAVLIADKRGDKQMMELLLANCRTWIFPPHVRGSLPTKYAHLSQLVQMGEGSGMYEDEDYYGYEPDLEDLYPAAGREQVEMLQLFYSWLGKDTLPVHLLSHAIESHAWKSAQWIAASSPATCHQFIAIFVGILQSAQLYIQEYEETLAGALGPGWLEEVKEMIRTHENAGFSYIFSRSGVGPYVRRVSGEKDEKMAELLPLVDSMSGLSVYRLPADDKEEVEEVRCDWVWEEEKYQVSAAALLTAMQRTYEEWSWRQQRRNPWPEDQD